MEKWGEEKYGRDIEGNGCAISVEKENPIFRWSTMASRFSKTFFSTPGAERNFGESHRRDNEKTAAAKFPP